MNKKIKIFLIIILIIIFLFFLLTQVYIPRHYPNLSEVLKEGVNISVYQLGKLEITKEVKISSIKDPFLSREVITKDTGIDSKQVLFLINNMDNYFKIVGKDLQILSYESNKLKFGILCNKTEQDLLQSIKKYEPIIYTTIEKFEEPNKICCIVFPIDPKNLEIFKKSIIID
jgi:hypothetical protein